VVDGVTLAWRERKFAGHQRASRDVLPILNEQQSFIGLCRLELTTTNDVYNEVSQDAEYGLRVISRLHCSILFAPAFHGLNAALWAKPLSFLQMRSSLPIFRLDEPLVLDSDDLPTVAALISVIWCFSVPVNLIRAVQQAVLHPSDLPKT